MNVLRRLLPSRDIDALLGDIIEEARHRSRVWYWAQLAAVLVVGTTRDIKRHPILALRAVAVGIVTLVMLLAPASALVRVVRVLSEGGYYVGPYWLTLPPTAIQWLPALVNTLGFTASGWTIARLHRSHGIAMVVPWALVVSSVLASFVIAALAADTYPTVWTAPKIGGVISTLLLPACVLVGGVFGLVGRKRRNRAWNRM